MTDTASPNNLEQENELCRLRSALCEELVCPICLELMRKPTTLVCGHSGCFLCMTHAIRHVGQCPTCRSPHSEPLTIHRTLANVLQHLRSSDPTMIESDPTATVAMLPSEDDQALQLRHAVQMNELSNLINMLHAGYDSNSRLALDGNNALAMAVRLNNGTIAQVLLDNGAHVDLQDTDGDTALMNAVYFRCLEMVQLLLLEEADPTLLSASGLTALDYALRLGCNGAPICDIIVQLLTQANREWVRPQGYQAPPPITKCTQQQEQDNNNDSTPSSFHYTIIPLENGHQMTVVAAAPMARAEASPASRPVGRLARGDTIFVTAKSKLDRYGESNSSIVCYYKFEQGPSHCPEGWLPSFLPTSHTQILLQQLDEGVQEEEDDEVEEGT